MSTCVELVDNRAAVLREINVAIEHLRDISAQFHGNEGLARLAMHQEIIEQICELAKLVQSAANPNSVTVRKNR
jgi:hypothetical protein